MVTELEEKMCLLHKSVIAKNIEGAIQNKYGEWIIDINSDIDFFVVDTQPNQDIMSWSENYQNGFEDGFSAGYSNALDYIHELIDMSNEELKEELHYIEENIFESEDPEIVNAYTELISIISENGEHTTNVDQS